MTKIGNEAKTDFLIERINQNEKAQSIDINEWAFSKITGSDKPLSILELCCGTGKQTAYLLKSFPNATVSCLDISEESIKSVRKTFDADSERMKFYNTDTDSFFETNQDQFDVIFCSYGLYYSKNIARVLSKIGECLKGNGRLVVMGPYGKNNKQLFDVLSDLNISISAAVISSSSTFMYEDVLKFATENFETTHIHTTENTVKWQTTEQVLSYWKNTTFFDAQKEKEFELKIEQQVKDKGYFINQKKIMLIETIKHA